MEPFEQLGFQWERSAVPVQMPRSSVERTIFRFHRMLPEYVWDAGALEGNPFTFPEVKTLLKGVTVGGRKLSKQEQMLNLAESSKRLIEMVKQRRFCAQEFNSKMVDFYVTRNATDMISFLVDCHPEAKEIRMLNPNITSA